jgi:hypothetical protein
VGLYTDTSKLKWIFWTSHHLVLPIDMLLKSSRNLSTRTNGSSGLQIHNNQSMTKTTLTNSLPKTSPSHRKRRVTGRQRRTPENGAISTKSPGTTLMNVAQNSHWWPRSKTRSRTLIQNLIMKILVKDRSSTQTPLLLSRPQTIQPEEPTDPEEGEHLFHSQMWVKGTPLHFIVDSGSQKNLISAEVVKQLGLSTTPHPQPYRIGWLHQGRDLHVNQQCRLSYGIQPFKDEVLCDVAPPDVCDVLLGQHICGNTMLSMSLDPVVSLLLWGFIDPGGYRWPPTFSKWLKTVFWPFWQFTIFSRF